MTTDFSELQQRVMQNKKNHNFNTTDIKFELLLLYGEVPDTVLLSGKAQVLNLELSKERF